MLWIILSLCSAVFVSLRHLYVKKWCSDSPSELLIFSTRIFGTVIMLPVAIISRPQVKNIPEFIGILIVTVLVTMAATIIQLKMIQTRSISRTIPYLSFIPLFMIPWTFLFFRQIPGYAALFGIILCCGGAYLLNISGEKGFLKPLKALMSDKRSRLMLFTAAALGLTTACDKIAIGASSAITYSFIWTCASALVMTGFVLRRPLSELKPVIFSTHTLIQSGLWAASFILQMAAVQAAANISSGVTYVKLLTMLNIMITVGFGGKIFGEGRLVQSLVSSGIMITGAAITIVFR